jgi:hypothetical protein
MLPRLANCCLPAIPTALRWVVSDSGPSSLKAVARWSVFTSLRRGEASDSEKGWSMLSWKKPSGSADIPEKHRKVMIAPNAATTSIWEKGRRYLIMVLAPVDSASIGALDIAAHNGLRTVAILNQNALLPKAVA